MPKLTNNYRDSQQFFIHNTVIPLIEANRKLPRDVRKTDSRMIVEIAFRYNKSVKQIMRLLNEQNKAEIGVSKIIQNEQLSLFYPTS